MHTPLLQEILHAQTRRYQRNGLGYTSALDAALQHLLLAASDSVSGVKGLFLRAQLRAAARELAENRQEPESALLPDPLTPTIRAAIASKAART